MKDKDTVSVLTAQLVSQLMYCSSRLQEEEASKIIKEISSLLCSYRKKIKNLGK